MFDLQGLIGYQLNSGAGLLRDMRQNLNSVVAVCEDRKKQTNHLRSLISDLAKSEIQRGNIDHQYFYLHVAHTHQ